MKYTLSKFDFMDWMQQNPNNPFSYNALEILWDYLNEYEQDASEEIEYDPISFRCDFCEQSLEDIISDNEIILDENMTEEEKYETVLNFLRDETTVLDVTNKGTIVYINF
jgi:hypothetical protein